MAAGDREAGPAPQARAVLAPRRGPPLRVSDQLVLRLLIWHDRPARTRIRLLVSESLCNLNYERLSDYEAHDLASPR